MGLRDFDLEAQQWRAARLGLGSCANEWEREGEKERCMLKRSRTEGDAHVLELSRAELDGEWAREAVHKHGRR